METNQTVWKNAAQWQRSGDRLIIFAKMNLKTATILSTEKRWKNNR